ncbi:WYL domain-containing protein [Paenibacillus filicis]|uniref:WYL domain-containing protein n=1 Tax=Paenibacillus filicis TaxID=669464 RepID=A0ABU9DGE4_9BACL
MARESFDKEVQFLRMLALTSGAYNRQQFAQRLGISVHTFDKTLRRLKEIVSSVHRQLPEEQGREFAETLRFQYYESAEPLLLFLFRAKSLKESESGRLSLLLASLKDRSCTALELLDVCSSEIPSYMAMPDEKTIRSDLKYLEEVGVIRRLPGARPYRYRLHNEFVEDLSSDELTDLYDFVDIMANTSVPSLQGYLLRDNLKKTLMQPGETELAEVFLYKYHYYSRILDEAHFHSLLHAIRRRRKVSFLYFSPKNEQSYGSANSNPLFEKESAGRQETVTPLQIVYDHQYGRWYLIGHHSRQKLIKFRMEGLTRVQEEEEVPEEVWQSRFAHWEDKSRFSWLVDTGNPVTVRARFFNPEGARTNFVRERVLLQGQWGQITEEEEHSFIYEITVNGITEIKPWLRSFGSSCEVLEPSGLRREIIAEWKEIWGYYEPVRENL